MIKQWWPILVETDVSEWHTMVTSELYETMEVQNAYGNQ